MNIDNFKHLILTHKVNTNTFTNSFIDFVYNEGQPNINLIKNKFTLNDNFNNYNNEEFEKLIISKLLEQGLKNNDDFISKLNNFDYEQVLYDNKTNVDKYKITNRKFIAKILNINNYVAVNGRIGPANVIIMNNKIYKELLKNNNTLLNNLSSFNIYKTDKISKDKILIYRISNNIEQPSMILFYNNNEFIITENSKNANKQYILLNINIEFLADKRIKKINKLYDKYR